MNFATYLYEGVERVGILSKDKTRLLCLNEVLQFVKFKSILELIGDWKDEYADILQQVLNNTHLWDGKGIDINRVTMKAPIPNLKRNAICVGLNYKDHIAESESALSLEVKMPEVPVYFSKMSLRAIGTGEAINSHPEITRELDYEVELAVVIGKSGSNIRAEEAEDHIFGYTILNDVTARDIQRDHKQWMKGKSLDTFTVIGPWISHKSMFRSPVELEIYSRVNGETRQNSNTKNFIFDIPSIISDLSRATTLEVGDIIATGTPAGVGMGFDPPKYLRAGDVVECYVEGIGSLINRVV